MCVVVILVVEFIKYNLVRRAAFLATIGYVAPTPNHVRVHHVQPSEIRVPIPYSICHEQNVRSLALARAGWYVCVCVCVCVFP